MATLDGSAWPPAPPQRIWKASLMVIYPLPPTWKNSKTAFFTYKILKKSSTFCFKRTEKSPRICYSQMNAIPYHQTATMKTLQLIPNASMHSRIEFKTLLFTYKALNGQAPSYFIISEYHYYPTKTLPSQNAVLVWEADSLRLRIG